METSQLIKEEFKQALEEDFLEGIYPRPSTRLIKTISQKPTKPSSHHETERITFNPQLIEDEKEVETRYKRVQVHNAAQWPNSVHGLLSVNFKGATCWGTGIMIGPNVVLTAGRNLYNFQGKAYADPETMQFKPGMNGDEAPFDSVGIEEYFVSPNYIREEKEDYGILILKKPIGEKTGYFALACVEPEEIKKTKVNVTGFPYDKTKSERSIFEMWGMEGTVCDIDQAQNLVSYLIDTERGQGGSGVWYQEGEDYYVCGVHVSGAGKKSTGTLLTRAMYKQIYAWLQQRKLKELLSKFGERAKELQINHQELNEKFISILANFSLESLTILDLSANQIESAEGKMLAQNTSWVNLSQLNLSGNRIGAQGAKALAQNTSWVNLARLNLSFNSIGPEGAKALAQNTSWINLSEFDLFSNAIGPEGASALAQNISWINLSRLNLYCNDIGAKGARALSQNISWMNLSQLNLRWNKIGAEGAKALAQNVSWMNLSQLDLSYNGIDAEGVKALAQNSSWVNLSRLDLASNCIGPEGVEVLARNRSWINLSQLNLSKNNIDADEAAVLKESKTWECIELIL